jgi:lipopolysaccharide export system protein LptC
VTSALALSDAARRERGMARWRARSQLIRRLRIILPAAMVLIIVLMVGWMAFGAALARLGDSHLGGQALIHMTNAQFFGRDSNGRPYVLGAAEAFRDDRDLKLVTLRGPDLTLDGGGDQANRMTADGGLYREDSRIVSLHGHVVVRTAQGDVFRTDKAVIDTVQGSVAGPSPVTGSGPTGEISAQTFGVYDRGARVVFRGEVHSRLKAD